MNQAPVATGTRAVLTLAFGKPYYLGLSINLARSFRIWNPSGHITLKIVTDLEEPLPADLSWVEVIRVSPGTYPGGFGAKLFLNSWGDADANLFLDADCLCFGDLGPVFERWSGSAFAFPGIRASTGEFFGDVASRCREFKVESVPRMIGSVYYWERGGQADAVFVRARELAKRYDELGFVRLRGVPNEEPLLSVACAQLGVIPEADDGSIKADAMAFRRIDRCDVTQGRPRLSNANPESLGYPTWLNLRTAEPVILHFNDAYAQGRVYLREQRRLRLLLRWPPWLAGAASWLRESLPRLVAQEAKRAAKPVYLRLFGPRRISASPRG